MKKQSQICVVGNGAVGKASALALAQAGYAVTLLSPPQAESNASKWKASGEWDSRVYALNHATKKYHKAGGVVVFYSLGYTKRIKH